MAELRKKLVTIPAITTGLRNIHMRYDEATGKIEWEMVKEDGSRVIKTSDEMTISETAITIAFDV